MFFLYSNFSNYKNRFSMPGNTENIFYRYVVFFQKISMPLPWNSISKNPPDLVLGIPEAHLWYYSIAYFCDSN